MHLIGLMPVRNEAWIIGFSARVALKWCDELIVADHGSTDGSREILETIAHLETGRLIIRDDRESEWREMEQRQMLLTEARDRGATHVAIIDADEVLTGNLVSQPRHPHVRDYMVASGQVLQLPGYNLRNSINQYHANGIWGQRWFSVAFADDPRLSWSGDRFHAREPQGVKLQPYRPIAQGQGGVMHLWGANERRLRAKHALYKVTERLRWPNTPVSEIDQMYNLWRDPEASRVMYPDQRQWAEPWNFADVPAAWWESYKHLMQYIDVDAEPWQEAEVRRLLKLYGRERFQGLDLFGVDK